MVYSDIEIILLTLSPQLAIFAMLICIEIIKQSK